MVVGDFRSSDINYKGWLELVEKSNQLRITSPVNNKTFHTDLGKSKKEITVSGLVEGSRKGRVLVVFRTDRDYPQALGKVGKDGKWSFSGCSLGGVDHQIYVVLIDKEDRPIIRSKIINVRLERKE